jgi:HAD superfamily hydrolase (TIGR01509 family)
MPQLKAVIFGSIGTVVETSDIQRQAFNLAFAEAGLDWQWNVQTYRDLLKINGGKNRIRNYGENLGVEISDTLIMSLHQAKTSHFATILANVSLAPRPGVVEMIHQCQRQKILVAFCTSTSKENISAIEAALASVLPFKQFATIVTIDQIAQPKPAPDAYLHCLKQLQIVADAAIAIEDTPVSLTAARAAGILTIATPGATTASQNFSAADLIVPDLSGVTFDQLSTLLELKIAKTK